MKNILLSAARRAFNASGDAHVNALYLHRAAVDYDPSTGEQTSVDTEENVRLIKTRVTEKHVSDRVLISDVRFISLQSEFSLPPVINGKISLESDVFEIVDIRPDAVNATWQIFARQ